MRPPELLADVAEWTRPKRKADSSYAVASASGARDVLLSRGEWAGLPYLEGVTTANDAADGSILTGQGTTRSTAAVSIAGVDLSPIPMRPTRDERAPR